MSTPTERLTNEANFTIPIKVERVSRRTFLNWLGVSTISTTIGVSGLKLGIDDILKANELDIKVTNDLDQQYPLTASSNSQNRANEQQFSEIKKRINQLLDEGQTEKLNNVTTDLDNQKIINQHTEYVLETSNRSKSSFMARQLSQDFLGLFPNPIPLTMAMFGTLFSPIALAGTYFRYKIMMIHNNKAKVSPKNPTNLSAQENHKSTTLTPQNIKQLWLPPIGGKIISIDDKNDRKSTWYILNPSLETTEQIGMINALKTQNYLGKLYIHQLSVQGRLDDRFKFAALALILDSPYPNDWNTPLYNAPWGKVAPLVHDGGNTKNTLNPLWQHQEGRTDFLQRINFTREPNYQQMNRLTPQEKSEVPAKQLIAALQDESEAQRLLIEAKFYQRIALAKHCHQGNISPEIPPTVQVRLYGRWRTFESNVIKLLYELNAQKLQNIHWFNSYPRTLWDDYPDRYEADWEPIKQGLIKLEEARHKHPDVLFRVRDYLIKVTAEIDQDLDLDTQFPKSHLI